MSDDFDCRLAFTTRLPLAVLIVMGIKRWENRSMMPTPSCGRCGMSVSSGSTKKEYQAFLLAAGKIFKRDVFSKIPAWDSVKWLRGKMIAVMRYNAGVENGDVMWDEGYPFWWHFNDIVLLNKPFSVKGNVGMWDVMEARR